jgi:hypothetical protein
MFESFEEALINVGETTVFTRRKGNGPPLLLLHGAHHQKHNLHRCGNRHWRCHVSVYPNGVKSLGERAALVDGHSDQPSLAVAHIDCVAVRYDVVDRGVLVRCRVAIDCKGQPIN